MATTTNSTTFQPAFKRVAQQGRHDDTFAAIAILTGKTLDSIMRQAETMGLPKIGPFHSYIDGDLIARICAAHGLVCTVWKECTKGGYTEVPEVAIAMVSYDADWEVRRCVVFGAVALECESHALLCYCPVRYLLSPHGSVFGCFGGAQAALPFRASVFEVLELEDWLPITDGAHWSHHFAQELPKRGDVLMEPPQLVRESQSTDWQLELRLSTGRSFRLLQNKECNRLQLAPVEVDAGKGEHLGRPSRSGTTGLG